MDREKLDGGKKTKLKKEKKRAGGKIASLLSRLSDWVYNSLIHGLFGSIFTSYSKEQTKLEDGYIKNYIYGSGRVEKLSRAVRGKVSESFEQSFFISSIRRMIRRFLKTPTKVYGNYFLSFGIYTLFAYFLTYFLPVLESPDILNLIYGFVITISSLPLLASKKSLAASFGEGQMTRALLEGLLGFRDENFSYSTKRSTVATNIAIILGMTSGLATVFVSPKYIILALAVFVLSALVFSSPEVGVIACLFAIPFCSFSSAPSIALSFIILITACSYIIKLARGKRIIKFDLLDVIVLIFMALIYFSGIISVGGGDSFAEAILACVLMLGYFLVVNMMRTELWVRRCIGALVTSGVIVALVGIIQYLMGYVSVEWLDVSYFSDIKGRATSLFDNANVLGFYLAIVFPLSLDLASRCEGRRKRFLAFVGSLMILICTVLTWSRGAWLAIIISGLAYLLMKSRKTLRTMIFSCMAIPILPIVLPNSIVRRFLSIGNIADSSTFYRIYTWKGSLRTLADNFWGGVGYGNSAFSEIYPMYAYAGIEAAQHSHNLYLQIAISMGFAGLAVFAVISFFFLQKNLEYMKKCDNEVSYGIMAALVAAFVGTLVMGMFDYIWYSNRIFFLFWAVMGIACAQARFGMSTKGYNANAEENDMSASADF